MKGKLDLAELLAGEPAAKHVADPGENCAQDEIIFQRDLGEHDAHRGVHLIPAHNIGFARGGSAGQKECRAESARSFPWPGCAPYP